MTKEKTTKPKVAGKEKSGRAQVHKIKPGKARVSLLSKLHALFSKLPSVGQYWTNSVQFVKEAWQELKKVNWPGRKETIGGTGVVLILVVIISIFLGLIDFSLSRLVRQIIH